MSPINLDYWRDDDSEFDNFLPGGALVEYPLYNIATDRVLQLMPTEESFIQSGKSLTESHTLAKQTRVDVANEMQRTDEGMVLVLNMLPQLMEEPNRFGTFLDSNPPPYTMGFTTDIGRLRLSLNQLTLYPHGVLHEHPTPQQDNTAVAALQLASTCGYAMGMVDPKELIFDGYGFRHRSFDEKTGAVHDDNWSYSSFGQARTPTPFDIHVYPGDYYSQPSRIRHSVAEPPTSRSERFGRLVKKVFSKDCLETLRHPYDTTRSYVYSIMCMPLLPGERSDPHAEKILRFTEKERQELWEKLTNLVTQRLELLKQDAKETVSISS
ncbi:MAG: hypothetical protein O3A80_05340 [bacterium]|nr:hypothetical protein [bacterium]